MFFFFIDGCTKRSKRTNNEDSVESLEEYIHGYSAVFLEGLFLFCEKTKSKN